MQASQRRPKSAAATLVARRPRTLEAPPWNNSFRVNRQRSTSASGGVCKQQGNGRPTFHEELYVHSAQGSKTATSAAALVATMPPAGEPQLELMCQLQDVVVRLSQCAVGEKQRLAHMQQRVGAYAALVREQDRIIDELRGMNIRLQKERDTLIAFRQQSLNHDFHLMSSLEGNGYGVEHARQEGGTRAPCGGRQPTSDPLAKMTPRSRDFVRSLVAQLRDERRKRLEVEEQSSRMIGEQQLTIHRLEDRLRTQSATCRSAFPDCMENCSGCSRTQELNEKRNLTGVNDNESPATEVSISGSAVSLAAVNGTNKSEKTPNTPTIPAASVVPVPELSLDHAKEALMTTCAASLLDKQEKVQHESSRRDIPLVVYDVNYKDATAILSDIRKKHGL